ncbi:MAG: RnfABCDGE type electron transport complex subunit D [Sedimentisphaerales bacterium]|nr:RnfABCDGE type electron transport complex subunit D [Sedimentisphaerales bacterium]MBN2843751.1 RnfABCDGE type electron transport complex subunit D [Sedimentisphaerales bacterium]
MKMKQPLYLSLSAPFRPVAETAVMMQYTQFVTLTLALLAVGLIRGEYAGVVGQALFPALLALSLEKLIVFSRGIRQDSSAAHSMLLAIVLWGMLEHDQWLISCFALIIAVLWKHLWGGLGNYLCHPALAAIAVIELICQSSDHTPLESNIRNYGRVMLSDISIYGNMPALSEFFAEKAPGLLACLTGQVGGAAAFCPAVFVLVGVYFIYRGYINWRVPVIFLSSFVLAALLLPLPVAGRYFFLPACGQGPDVLITWLSYQLLTGPLIFAAAVLFVDTTSRPMTLSGQAIFALLAGPIIIALRFYTPLFYPEAITFAALGLIVPLLDHFTRPARRGRGRLSMTQ